MGARVIVGREVPCIVFSFLVEVAYLRIEGNCLRVVGLIISMTQGAALGQLCPCGQEVRGGL